MIIRIGIEDSSANISIKIYEHSSYNNREIVETLFVSTNYRIFDEYTAETIEGRHNVS